MPAYICKKKNWIDQTAQPLTSQPANTFLQKDQAGVPHLQLQLLQERRKRLPLMNPFYGP